MTNELSRGGHFVIEAAQRRGHARAARSHSSSQREARGHSS
jgi:hypothetical protein